MIKKIAYLLLLSSLFVACSNDFDLIDDNKKEIPVVYGFLSKKDTAQYFRIERAFADEKISASELAQNPDALYYDNIKVQLIRKSNSQVYNLTKVDGTNEGYPRKAGAFAIAPNYLYKINTNNVPLVDNETYKLVIKDSNDATITEAETIIVPDMALVEGRTLIQESTGPRLSVFTGFNLFWNTSGANGNIANAKIYNVKMFVEINELPKDGSPLEKLNLIWEIAKGYTPTTAAEINLITNTVQLQQKDGTAFYRFLNEQLASRKPASRKISSIKVRVDAGGKEIFNYIDIGKVNLGITGTEVVPTYSNIKNGYGVMSSSNYFISNNLILSARSIDSLLNGRYTRTLGFIN